MKRALVVAAELLPLALVGTGIWGLAGWAAAALGTGAVMLWLDVRQASGTKRP